jgi:integrase
MTRYPRSGPGRKWTTVELKAIGPDWAGDTLADSDGLFGTVRVKDQDGVSIHFRYGFRWEGRKVWYYCGTRPVTSLEALRRARDQAKTDIRAGVNPNDKRTAVRIENQRLVERTIQAEAARAAEDATLQMMFDRWVQDGVARKDGNAEIRRSFGRDVLPVLGSKPVRLVTEHDLRGVLRSLVSRGVNRMAVLLCRDLRQMFTWAEKRQPWRRLLLDGNPAALIDIERIVPPEYDLSNVRDRVLSADEIRELKAIFARMQAQYEAAADRRRATRPLQMESQIALWICLSTCCRIGELLMSRWEHLNLQHGTWFIPKENVKGARGKKQEQLIYLSPFALAQFERLHALSGHTEHCFPSRDGERHLDVKTVSKQVRDRQQRFKNRGNLRGRTNDNTLVLSGGSNGEWTPHDLRRTAATMMQALGVSPDVIDRCQNHLLSGSRVRRHYMKHEYADEKRAAWELLGTEIENILSGAAAPQAGRRRSEALGMVARDLMHSA